MTRSVCPLLVATALLFPSAAPAAAQMVGRVEPASASRRSEAPSQDLQVKKRYSRGMKDGGRAEAPVRSVPARAAAVRWEPVVGMDAQLFPSFIVSTATIRLPQEADAEEDPRQLGEALGFVGASLDNVPSGSRIRVEVKPNAVMEASAIEASADAGAGDYHVYPKINYRYDVLLDWRQPMPLNITMETFVDGRSFGTRSTTVAVRSINDCPLAILAGDESDEEDLDLSWMFAAYVNENHPFVATLTREAIESGIVNSFDAYQSEEPSAVLAQVYAIWHVLQRRGIRYGDISQSSAESEIVASQHVRLFEESLDAKQANCVDGTALLAAVLRKIGIAPYLVTVPGHMFLAFDLDEDGEHTVGLETTMMGSAVNEVPRSRTIPQALADRFKGQASFRSFAAALEAGTKQLTDAADKFESDDADYQLISVSEARRIGILPLAYRRTGR